MPRATTTLLSAVVVVGAALPAAARTPADPPVLDCKDTFAKTVDHAALVKRFGRENIAVGQLDGAEGQTERGTILYPKDPARRIEVFWWNGKGLRRPASVVVRDKSRWVVRASGEPERTVGVGTPVAGVEAANGGPFTLNGFQWDMGGYGTDWKGGRLGTIAGGCALSLRFDPDPKAGAAIDRVSGERTFSSSAPAIKAVRPTVSKLSLDWPE